jgi:hypothetical protein
MSRRRDGVTESDAYARYSASAQRDVTLWVFVRTIERALGFLDDDARAVDAGTGVL